MPIPHLALSVRCSNRGKGRRLAETDEKTMKTHLNVFKRDSNTCMFCGFKSNLLQEIHHRNGDHADNDPANLATICELCHLVQHIDTAGNFIDSTLIRLPEISQAALNHLVRTMLVAQRHAALGHANKRGFSAITHHTLLSEKLESVSKEFRLRQKDAAKHIGDSDPAVLGLALGFLSEEEYERRGELLKELRLLPHGLQTQMMHKDVESMVGAWTRKGGPYFGMPPETWGGIMDKMLFCLDHR